MRHTPLRLLSVSALIAALITSTCLLTACGGNEVIQPTVSVSVGQQLIDLKKARDSGAITASDYDKQKSNLINNVK